VSDNTTKGHGGKTRDEKQDRRRSPRVEIQQRLWCEKDGLTVLVETRNISRGGLCVLSAVRSVEGTRFLLSYQRADNEVLLAPVEVVWHRSRSRGSRPGLGLRFLSEREGEELYESFLVRRSERKSYPPGLLSWAATTAPGKLPR
jgi:hypothetical protein